jgi:hypothetical protein
MLRQRRPIRPCLPTIFIKAALRPGLRLIANSRPNQAIQRFANPLEHGLQTQNRQIIGTRNTETTKNQINNGKPSFQ